MAIRLLPGYGVVIETQDAAALLPGYGVLIESEAGAATAELVGVAALTFVCTLAVATDGEAIEGPLVGSRLAGKGPLVDGRLAA